MCNHFCSQEMGNIEAGKEQNKKRARIEIQPRFKIQYPMKNRNKCILSFWNKIYPKVGIF